MNWEEREAGRPHPFLMDTLLSFPALTCENTGDGEDIIHVLQPTAPAKAMGGEIISLLSAVFSRNVGADGMAPTSAKQLLNDELRFFSTGGTPSREVTASRDGRVGCGEPPGARRVRRHQTASSRKEAKRSKGKRFTYSSFSAVPLDANSLLHIAAQGSYMSAAQSALDLHHYYISWTGKRQ